MVPNIGLFCMCKKRVLIQIIFYNKIHQNTLYLITHTSIYNLVIKYTDKMYFRSDIKMRFVSKTLKYSAFILYHLWCMNSYSLLNVI